MPGGVREAVLAATVTAVLGAFGAAFSAAAPADSRALARLLGALALLGGAGYVLAFLAGAARAALGAVGGVLVGAAAASLFYVAYPIVGTAAMLAAWSGLWLGYAFLLAALGSVSEPVRRTLVRGAAASVLAGIGLWAGSGLWLTAAETGAAAATAPAHLPVLAAWLAVTLPGFIALLVGRRR